MVGRNEFFGLHPGGLSKVQLLNFVPFVPFVSFVVGDYANCFAFSTASSIVPTM